VLEYNWFWSGDKQTDDKAINIKVGQEIHKKSNKNFQKSFQLIKELILKKSVKLHCSQIGEIVLLLYTVVSSQPFFLPPPKPSYPKSTFVQWISLLSSLGLN